MKDRDSATLALTKALIERASVTPDDAGCQAIMIERLQAIGFEVEYLPFGEGEERVENFWASKRPSASSDRKILAFAGHTDVVPSGDVKAWQSPPFEPRIDANGILYGRGAADMKGSLAAMVTACEAFLQEHPNHRHGIAFLITSDEEGPATNGTVKVMEHLSGRDEFIDWCVVGEPSSTDKVGDVVKNGRRGSLNAKLIIKGVQGHVAYPQLASNPIHSAAPALTELCAEVWDQGNDFFPPTSFQISNIKAGTGATNVIPGTLELLMNFRFSTESTAADLRQRSEAILQRHGLEYDIDWTLSGEPFLTGSGELVEATIAAIQSVCGFETELSTAGGTSDGRFIAPTGTQLVELGPCNASIHKIDEHVRASDLDILKDIYVDIMKRLLL